MNTARPSASFYRVSLRSYKQKSAWTFCRAKEEPRMSFFGQKWFFISIDSPDDGASIAAILFSLVWIFGKIFSKKFLKNTYVTKKICHAKEETRMSIIKCQIHVCQHNIVLILFSFASIETYVFLTGICGRGVPKDAIHLEAESRMSAWSGF